MHETELCFYGVLLLSMSAPVIYFSVRQYIESCSSLQAKIDALENIIFSMLGALATAATTGEFEEYRFDDGQTKIEVIYRSPESIQKAITGLQFLSDSLRARQFNNSNGRITRLVPGENFYGHGGGGWYNV